MLGKRMSNAGKGRSSLKNDSTTTANHKTSSSTSTGANKQSKSAPDDRKPIVLPLIKTQDNATKLPTYNAVLSRPNTNPTVQDDELDTLQFELESLLSMLAVRTNIINIEIDADDYRLKDYNKRMKLNVKQAQLAGNRKRTFEKLPQGVTHKGTKAINSLFKSKNLKRAGIVSGSLSRNINSNDATLESKSDLTKPVVIKNDIAFKFWASVEPYCAQLGPADLERLSKIIAKYEEPLPAIPDLGPHYTERWTAEDLLMEQNFSSTDPIPPKKIDMKLNIPAHIATMLKKTEGYDGDVPGPLTHRLLSALLNHSDMDNIDQNLNSDSEKILRKELITLGIMDEDDFPKPNPDDEVWEETKRVYTDLVALNKQNVQKLKELHSAAQVELKKVSLRRKLNTVDNQILDIHKKFQLAKQEKRQINDKELQDAERLLKEQINLNEKIGSIPSAGPHWI